MLQSSKLFLVFSCDNSILVCMQSYINQSESELITKQKLKTKMEKFPVSFAFLLCLIIFFAIFVWSINRLFVRPGKNLPPSPLRLPVIGHLHHLSRLPHRNFHSLDGKLGPVMLLHFGKVPVLIVSSADYAREIMKTHDLVFASRPGFEAYKRLLYNGKDVAFAPYGEHWRKMKSLFVLQLLSNKRVQSSRWIREEETTVTLKKIEGRRGPVDLSALFAEFTSDLVGRSAFGRRFSESGNGRRFLCVLQDFIEVLGFINIGDFVPWLGWIGRFNGFNERLDRTAKEMDEVIEGVVQELLDVTRDGQVGKNLMDDLMGDTHDGFVDRDGLKAIILEVFVAGSDTISTSLKWMMSELLRHPTVMEKLQCEVRGIVKHKHDITDDDLEKMHYLKAVFKETLRYHPPGPLLVPRIARKDVQIKGFDVSAGTVVMINAWTIGRDPESWDEPEKFMPERFLNSSTDFRGQDFEFTPFGAGRRGCPGITFSTTAVELLMASLMQKFDWKLPDGIEAKDLDMSESPGLVVHRNVPLLAVASQCV